eukprot:1990562-Rhodomonas_salina.2
MAPSPTRQQKWYEQERSSHACWDTCGSSPSQRPRSASLRTWLERKRGQSWPRDTKCVGSMGWMLPPCSWTVEGSTASRLCYTTHASPRHRCKQRGHEIDEGDESRHSRETTTLVASLTRITDPRSTDSLPILLSCTYVLARPSFPFANFHSTPHSQLLWALERCCRARARERRVVGAFDLWTRPWDCRHSSAAASPTAQPFTFRTENFHRFAACFCGAHQARRVRCQGLLEPRSTC